MNLNTEKLGSPNLLWGMKTKIHGGRSNYTFQLFSVFLAVTLNRVKVQQVTLTFQDTYTFNFNLNLSMYYKDGI